MAGPQPNAFAMDDTGAVAIEIGAPPVIDDYTMQDILDKLVFLEYEENFLKPNGTTFKPLSRTFFEVAAENVNAQFFYFTNLVSWLMKECGSDAFRPPGQFDDPNAVSTDILQHLKNTMGLNEYAKDIAPSKIRQGHGEQVLLILVLLVDKALLAKGFTFKSIVYPEPSEDVTAQQNESIDAGSSTQAIANDEIVDMIAVDSSDDDEEFTGIHGMRGKAKNAAPPPSQVDPKEWQLEVERVSGDLQYRDNDIRDWRTRVDNASTLMKAVEKMYPDVKSMLEMLGNDLSKTLERIQKREQTLGQQFHEQVEDYRAKLRELNAVQDQVSIASKTVSGLSMELNGVTESLEYVKSEIQSREEKSSDITPLMKIKEAVTKVKSEIKDMSLRIGVLQHTVLQYSLRANKTKREKWSRENGKNSEGDLENDGGYITQEDVAYHQYNESTLARFA